MYHDAAQLSNEMRMVSVTNSLPMHFTFQFGLLREHIQVTRNNFSLNELKELAATTVSKQFPQAQAYGNLSEKIHLFLHDDKSENILQIIKSSSNQVENKSIIEIVLSGDFGESSSKIQPHILHVHSYRSPAFCDYCGELLFGIVRQGLRCEGCGLNYHKRCAYKIPNNCTMQRKRKISITTPPPTHFHNGITPQESFASTTSIVPQPSKTSKGSARPLWVEGYATIRVPHTFQVHTYTRPTVCHYCRRLLKGIFKQGMQCKDCKFNCHKRCMREIPDNCPGELTHDSKTASEADMDESELESDSDSNEQDVFPPNGASSKVNGNGGGNTLLPPSVDVSLEKPPQQHHHVSTSEDNSMIVDEPQEQIPLMRIAESFRNTKHHSRSTILREGWLLHFNNSDATDPTVFPMLSRRFWRLDSKSLTQYRSNQGTNFTRDIPLSKILSIEMVHKVEEGTNEPVNFLKLNTNETDIFITSEKDAKVTTLTKWRDSINKALKPVDSTVEQPTSSKDFVKRKVSVMISFQRDISDEKASDISEIYQVFPDDVLGSGQFGIVYGGKHRKRGFDVAVKVVEKQRFQHKEESQLRHEVQILESLDNPGIVRLYNMFETPEQIFVVMEKLRGDMLEMILSSERGRLPERMTKFLITQILMALRYLHKQNVVHCDLKPENVLLSTDDAFPQLKLCDFGFARIIGQKSFRRSVVGTPAYLAPEVLKKECYNRSLDMWSVGVIIYVSLSGTFPFNEDEDINQQIQNADFMFPPQPWQEITQLAQDLIKTLLQVKKRKRPSVDKALCHGWLHDYTCWQDLRILEKGLGKRYLTHESDDERWQQYMLQMRQHI